VFVEIQVLHQIKHCAHTHFLLELLYIPQKKENYRYNLRKFLFADNIEKNSFIDLKKTRISQKSPIDEVLIFQTRI
jgi:hypothetical protein